MSMAVIRVTLTKVCNESIIMFMARDSLFGYSLFHQILGVAIFQFAQYLFKKLLRNC